jgi:hypothetical protein
MASEIAISMKNFLGEHPRLKFLFFGGKAAQARPSRGHSPLAGPRKKTFASLTRCTLSVLGTDTYGRITLLPGGTMPSPADRHKDTIDKSQQDIGTRSTGSAL